MIFDPKKAGSFFDIFDPPPHLPPPPPKKWVSSGGSLGGSGPKTHWAMRLLDKIMILQGVKLTIQPLRVGYANRLKMGGMWRFPLYTPAWLLSNNLCEVISVFELLRRENCISRLCALDPLGLPPPPNTQIG